MSEPRACTNCARVQAYPAPVCRGCGGAAFHVCTLPMTAVVYSHTTVHRAPNPAMAAAVPYTVVLVRCLGGGLLLMRFDGNGVPAVGATVQVVQREDVLVALSA